MPKSNSFIQKLGPGLLYAGAAIGVSHLVQSTRAGALFGAGMLAVVIVANFFKYPFFQYGPRYVAATGKSLLHGYQKLGAWAVWLYFLLTIGTMFIIQGAVTMVTAGLAKFLTGIDIPLLYWMLIVLAVSAFLLSSGKIKVLDKFMKVVMVVLALTTIAAAISSVFADVVRPEANTPFSFTNKLHILFLIAFVGWMPAPIDISVWYSVWAESKANEAGEKQGLKNSLFDFNVGYWGTAFLALCFVILGAMMLYNTGTNLSPNAVVFAQQIIDAYALSLGDWSKPIISIAAFTTMLSTTISVMDGITRTMVPTVKYLYPTGTFTNKHTYTIWLAVLGIGSLLLVGIYAKNMKQMVDFATSISFLTAPILALLNIRVMHSPDIATEFKPTLFTQIISYIGLFIITLFSATYLYYTFL